MIKTLLVMLLSASLLTSCTKMGLDVSDLQSDIYLASTSTSDYTRLKQFTVKGKAGWLFFGAVSTKKFDLSAALKDEISKQNGDAIINLTIKTQTTFVDGLVTIIALVGLLYIPRTVVVSGTVVDINEASGLRPQNAAEVVFVTQENESYYVVSGIIDAGTTLEYMGKDYRSLPVQEGE